MTAVYVKWQSRKRLNCVLCWSCYDRCVTFVALHLLCYTVCVTLCNAGLCCTGCVTLIVLHCLCYTGCVTLVYNVIPIADVKPINNNNGYF